MKSFQLALMASVILLLSGLNSGGLGAALQADTADSSADNPIMERHQQDSSPQLSSDRPKNRASPSRIAFADWRNFTKNYVRNASPPDSTTQLDESLPQRQPARQSRDSPVTILASYTEHDPIFIDHYDNFTQVGFTGNGLPTDPFIFEGWNITNITGPLIEIQDTTAYFNISGNLLNGVNQASTGISLSNVMNGTIENNFIGNLTQHGIALLDSHNNTISNNTVYECGDGIILWGANNNTIVNNTAFNNTIVGMSLDGSDNTIVNNTAFNNTIVGMSLDGSDNTIVNNTAFNNTNSGIDLGGSDNTVANNTVYNSADGIGLWDSNNNTIADNTIFNVTGFGGIHSWFSDNNTISNNTIFDCNNSGMHLNAVNNNLFSNNTIYNCQVGIAIFTSSNNNTIANNTLHDNNGESIGLASSNNNTVIAHNTVYGNNGTGISVGGSNNAVIAHNTVYGNNGTGISVGGSNNTVIAHNTVYGNNETGIFLWNSHNNSIANNTVYNCQGGIGLGDSNNNTIVNNTAFNNTIVGMSLVGSDNTVVNNTAFNNTNSGIDLGGSNNTVANNTIYNCQDGIGLDGFSSNNTIANNTVYGNNGPGISLGSSDNNTIAKNTVFNNGAGGISLGGSNNNIISYNTLHDNMENGIFLGSANNNLIANNIIYNTAVNPYSAWGIHLVQSNENLITNNTVYNNAASGIHFNACSNNTVSKNTIYGHQVGIFLGTTSPSGSDSNIIVNNCIYGNDGEGILVSGSINTVEMNDLSGNNPGGAQASDDGSDNVFINNYWSDWNGMGSYAIDGPAGNQDPSPLVNPYHLSAPIITAPTSENLTLSGVVSLHWNASRDAFGHSLTYATYYSTNDGATWTLLASGLTTTASTLDTTPFADGTAMRFRVEAIDSGGFIAKAIPEATFYIWNTHHQLSPPALTFPTGGETLSGTVDVGWRAAKHTWAHTVTYTLYYSTDGGTSWNPLATNLTATSYAWETTTTPDGTNYLLKVNAACTGGLSAETVSLTAFTVHNAISIPTIASPNGGETLQGTVTIEWAATVDSANHAITYAVYSSSNEGVTWTLLASGLTATSYSWDTTTGPNGLSYLLKVAATCSEGGTTEDVSDGTFAIQNGEPAATSSTPSKSTPALTGLVLLLAIGAMIALREVKTKIRSRQTRK
ncbi:MAG: right-handed parallel beta-helix repeat-containing protein [Candidatus Heimdallarchaeota archaeon]